MRYPITPKRVTDIFQRVSDCLDLCRVERKGISAEDIDWMIVAERHLGFGRKLKSGDLATTLEILERVERSDPE